MLSDAVLSKKCLASCVVRPIQRGEDAGEMAVAKEEYATAICPQTGDRAVCAGTHRCERLTPVEDGATDGRTEIGRGHDQLPIGAPGFLGLGNPQLGKSLVAGGIAFIHCQQTLVAGDRRTRGVYKLLCIHLGLPHFQFRISGMSTPCSLMYCLCSRSLSASCCLR